MKNLLEQPLSDIQPEKWKSKIDVIFWEIFKFMKIPKSKLSYEYISTSQILSTVCFNYETLDEDLKNKWFNLLALFWNENIDWLKAKLNEIKKGIIEQKTFIIVLFDLEDKLKKIAFVSKDDTPENIRKYAIDELDNIFPSDEEMAKMGIL